MFKKTTILIIILAALTAFLVYMAIKTDQEKNAVQPQETVLPTKPIAQKTARLFFSPATLTVSSTRSASQNVYLMLDAGNENVTGVQVEMKYDPQTITFVSIKAASDTSSFFGVDAINPINDIDNTNGAAVFAAAISPSAVAKKGIGRLATITLTALSSTQATANVAILEKSIVTKPGSTESVLGKIESLIINFSSSGVQNATFTPTPTAAAQ